MENGVERVDCNRCETQERERSIAGNFCYACRRALSSSDIKFVMPSRARRASDLPLQKRLMCTECYRRFASRNRSGARSFVRMSARKLGAVRNSLLIKSVQF